MLSRRTFLHDSAAGILAVALLGSPITTGTRKPRLKISLAQWSLHRALQGGRLDHLDFAAKAASFGIDGVEYVNTFFKDKARNSAYLAEMNLRAEDAGVRQLLIMIDEEGGLGETNDTLRKQAVDNHRKWLDAAHTLGCQSIRVNAYGDSTDRAARHTATVEGLGELATLAAQAGLNVIVENHGGLSSDGAWLSGVMRAINMPNCGTLPDFGNFCLRSGNTAMGEKPCAEEYDRYRGVEELMPFAKAVSAKSYDFDANGDETTIDFVRMLGLVKAAGYKGYIGIEYEGSRLPEEDGIRKTKALLDRLIG